MNAVPEPALVTPEPSDHASNKTKKTWTLQPIHKAWDNLTSRKIKMAPANAVADFLSDMMRVSNRLFPDWEACLKTYIEESDLEFLAKREFFEKQDLFMYFYCGVVAI